MTDVRWATSPLVSRPMPEPPLLLTPRSTRCVVAASVVLAVGLTFALADDAATSRAVANAGSDLARLLRFMAVIKGVFALGAWAVVLWRLGSPISLGRFAAYGAGCGVMAAGPGLIWGMVHVGLGALMLHGGLVALLVLLWRDPAIPVRLEAALAQHRLKDAAGP